MLRLTLDTAVDVDLECWMKTAVLPCTSTTVVIAICRFAVPVDKVPSGDVEVVVVWVLGFIGSTAEYCPMAFTCYVAYSFLQNKQIVLD